MSMLATRSFTQGLDLDWAPDVDCYDVENGMRIRVDLPGCRKEDVTAEFNEGNLIISGERKLMSQGMKYLNERLYGKFSRAIYLPAGCQLDQIKAQFNDGVLDLFVPREPLHEPKKVQIE